MTNLDIPHLAPDANSILVSLTEWGILAVSGPDAKKFLQGQLTCDVDKITAQHGSLGAHCNPQGRVISLFYLFFFQDTYYLVMKQQMLTHAMLALKKYSIFYKTALNEVSDKFCVIGYNNPRAREMIAGVQLACLTLPAASPRYLSLISAEIKNSLWDTLTLDCSFTAENDWKRLDISDKIPAIYPETSGQFLPHEINLPQLNAVSFHKGCFTGQEIIARMHYRGKMKKQLYHANISTSLPLLPGSTVYDANQQAVGTIVDCYQDTNLCFGVLMILDNSAAKDHLLFLDQEQRAPFIGLE